MPDSNSPPGTTEVTAEQMVQKLIKLDSELSEARTQLKRSKEVCLDLIKEKDLLIRAQPASLRDQMAMAALTGILGCLRDYTDAHNQFTRSKLAYEYADTMLEVREFDAH